MLTNVGLDPDKELVDLLRSGDRKAFECIYRRYWPVLYDSAYKRIKSREVTEELIQDLFATLWNKRQELFITSSFAVYLFTALKYKIINYMRSEVTKNSYLAWAKYFQPKPKNTVEEKILFNELNNALEREINRLPDNCKIVFIMSRKQDLTLKEIALSLNLSINTVEKQMSRALKILRANLKDYITALILLFSFLFN